MTQHKGFTPGPWNVQKESGHIVSGYGGRWGIAMLYWTGPTVGPEGSPIDSEEMHANARLIADAPTLLAERDRLQTRVEELETILRESRQHTQGDWEYTQYSAKQCEVMGPKEVHICFLPNTPQGRSDARLIARAPKLDARVKELESSLREVRDLLDGYAHVTDGDYGQPEGNKAMKAQHAIDEVLKP